MNHNLYQELDLVILRVTLSAIGYSRKPGDLSMPTCLGVGFPDNEQW
jgi:hypothetical protein